MSCFLVLVYFHVWVTALYTSPVFPLPLSNEGAPPHQQNPALHLPNHHPHPSPTTGQLRGVEVVAAKLRHSICTVTLHYNPPSPHLVERFFFGPWLNLSLPDHTVHTVRPFSIYWALVPISHSQWDMRTLLKIPKKYQLWSLKKYKNVLLLERK